MEKWTRLLGQIVGTALVELSEIPTYRGGGHLFLFKKIPEIP
jgi:hypothetical protein